MTKHRLFDEDALVIGLGRFGAAAALEMDRLGYRVHAIEQDPVLAERYSRKLMRVLSLDATKPEELREARPSSFRVAEKLGARPERRSVLRGDEAVVYRHHYRA